MAFRQRDGSGYEPGKQGRVDSNHSVGLRGAGWAAKG